MVMAPLTMVRFQPERNGHCATSGAGLDVLYFRAIPATWTSAGPAGNDAPCDNQDSLSTN